MQNTEKNGGILGNIDNKIIFRGEGGSGASHFISETTGTGSPLEGLINEGIM